MRNKNRARSLRQIRRSRSGSKRGVSPVIGVILMVAATIVIAGVVMAMLGGFGPPSKTYTVTATASQSADDIIVTYIGGPDQVEVANLIFSGTKSDGNVIDWKDTQEGVQHQGAWDAANNTITTPTVGDSVIAAGEGTTGRDHVIVMAKFKDGTTQVILDTYV